MSFNRSIDSGFSQLLATVFVVGFLTATWNISADTSAPSTTTKTSHRAESSDRSTNSRTVATATEPGDVIKGKATFYGPGLHGKKTATGERFNSNAMTAASNRVPLGSEVLVTNLKNGKTAKVRINDCGPNRRGHKIDLSKRAARTLDMTHDGTARVKAEVISTPDDPETCADLKKSARR